MPPHALPPIILQVSGWNLLPLPLSLILAPPFFASLQDIPPFDEALEENVDSFLSAEGDPNGALFGVNRVGGSSPSNGGLDNKGAGPSSSAPPPSPLLLHPHLLLPLQVHEEDVGQHPLHLADRLWD